MKLQSCCLLLLPIIMILPACSSHLSEEDAIHQVLPKQVDFNFHIKPILSDRCFSCHGPDEKARKGNLRLDVEASAFAMLDSSLQNFAIVPGNLRRSQMYQRITSRDPKMMMPPPESNLALSAYEIELIKRWIKQGAEWKPHWAFISPTKVPLPEVRQKAWPLNPIDHFILARLEQEGIGPSEQARKEKLVRRLSFDLTGLPPGPAAIDRFLADQSPDAYERLVDQFLASAAFGERLATEWMDLARYAETNGYHHDFERNMWPWRDWVIKAFNENMPYDKFVTWQLAGDLLPEPTYEQRLATAFNRNNRTTQECGSIDEEFRVSYVIDRTNTFGKAFLGLTLECAQCHDHKYDPLSQVEYYQLFAFFNQVPEKGVTKSFRGQSAPFLELPAEQVSAVQAYIEEQIQQEYGSGTSEQDPEEVYRPVWQEEMEAMAQPTMVMQEMDTMRATYVLERGLYDAQREKVRPATPDHLLPFNASWSRNRLGLTKWLFDPENPLTARVVVNRYWQMIFGRGIVDTPEDFGNQGALPSHPGLLDWLAVRLIESGWDIKELLKLMVMSRTYRQSPVARESALTADPQNRWLGRGPQERLTAEMIRDQALKVSGLLDRTVGGPSVKPYQPEGLWVQVSSGGRYQRKYMQSHGPALYRRSLYTYWKRIQPPPAMMIFDAANRNQCTVKRQSTSTPLQALVTLNDPQFVEAARVFAERIMTKGGDGLSERLSFAFKGFTSRYPDDDELNILKELYRHEYNEFKAFPGRAEALLDVGEYTRDGKLDAVDLAAWSVVANAIMNLSESLQKG